MTMVEAALGEAGLRRPDIEGLAVGLGPGSYMGIRASIALAQGWSLATGIPLAGVSSVDAMAHCIQGNGARGELRVVVDAHRAELYLAGYELGEDEVEVLDPLHLTTGEALITNTPGSLLVSPDRLPEGVTYRSVQPSAHAVGALAFRRSLFRAESDLEPIYLREAQFVKAPPARVIPSA